MIVADTSLLANFYLGDRQEEAVAVFQRDEEWFVSPLWRYELQNTLLKHIELRQLPISDCERVMEKASVLLHLREREVSTVQVLQVATTHEISAYDANYVALARQLRVPLITFDKKLVRAARGIALSPQDFLR